jgi:hypothetical protein
MDEPTIPAGHAGDAAAERLKKPSQGRSPALRLLAADGRLIRRRPAVLAAALAARLHALRGHAIWPAPAAPIFGVEPAVPKSASWLRETFEAGGAECGIAGFGSAVRGLFGAATWTGLRAGGFLVGRPPAWLLDLCGELLGRDARRSSLALFSRSGAPLTKAIYFLFEAGAHEPSLVVLAMADPSQSRRLKREYDSVATLASSLAEHPEITRALPLEPMFRGENGGEYLVIVPPDPLAAAVGNEDRTVALDWLLQLQTVSSSGARAWANGDAERLLGVLDEAWGALRPSTLAIIRERVGSELGALLGSPVPRGAVHGDYWHGNIACDGKRLRVYDWEWTSMDGPPFLDLWTYEFGVLLRPPRGGAPAGGLMAAVARVAGELARRQVRIEFALATVAPSLAQLAIRMRRATGRPGPAEAALVGLIEEAEDLLVQD